MRFVVPETRRIDLKDGPSGEKNWIVIRRELTKGEDSRMRSGGLKRLMQGDKDDEKSTAVDVDWEELALSRVLTYVVDWSAKDPETGKDVKFSPKAVSELCTEDFQEIDDAIKAHIKEMEEEKKARTGRPQPAPISS